MREERKRLKGKKEGAQRGVARGKGKDYNCQRGGGKKDRGLVKG